jgi:hypothetical protein
MSPAWRRKQGCAVKLLAIGMGPVSKGPSIASVLAKTPLSAEHHLIAEPVELHESTAERKRALRKRLGYASSLCQGRGGALS